MSKSQDAASSPSPSCASLAAQPELKIRRRRKRENEATEGGNNTKISLFISRRLPICAAHKIVSVILF